MQTDTEEYKYKELLSNMRTQKHYYTYVQRNTNGHVQIATKEHQY